MNFLPAGIDVGDAGRDPPCVVQVEAEDLTAGAQLEEGIGEEHRQQHRLRTGFREVLAGEPLAVAAERTGLERQPFGVGIRLTEVARGLRVRMIAESLGSLPEQGGSKRFLLRWSRILARARVFKDVAARYLLSPQVARLATHTQQVLEPVEMRFELRPRHAPILDGHVVWDEPAAVTLRDPPALLEVIVLKAEQLAVPVHHRAAKAGTYQEAAPPSHRQGCFGGGVP